MNDVVLNRSEILEFIDQHCSPSVAYLRADVIEAEKVCRLHHEHVEVNEIATR
jgi:hypothetical protein